MKFLIILLSLLAAVCCQEAFNEDVGAPATTVDPNCVDLAGNCAKINLCTNAIYGSLMHKNCRKYCGFCNDPIPPTNAPAHTTKKSPLPDQNCHDENPKTGSNSCQALEYLCTEPAYIPLMKRQCAKTCRYCH